MVALAAMLALAGSLGLAALITWALSAPKPHREPTTLPCLVCKEAIPYARFIIGWTTCCQPCEDIYWTQVEFVDWKADYENRKVLDRDEEINQ